MPEPKPSGARLLVVDDDALFGRVVSRALAQAGYSAVVVETGAQALAAASAELPRLVLLDVGLPDLGGLEVCRRLRSEFSAEDLPIVMLTGQHDDAAISAAFEAGATDFLTKPISVPLLLQRVRFALRAAGAFRRLADNERSLARGQELAGIGQFDWSPSSGALSLSAQALRLLGSPPAKPSRLSELVKAHVHPDDREAMRDALCGNGTEEPEVRVRNLGAGGYRTLRLLVDRAAVAENDRVVATLRDVTDDVERRQRIQKAAYYDATTGLPNRKLFESRVDAALHAAAMDRFAVMFVDLDGFKQVNDTLGHHGGDALLRHVGAQLLAALRVHDPVGRLAASGSVGRWGGDEFAVLLGPIRGAQDAELVAERILQRAAEPLSVRGNDHSMRLSIGIALYPEHGSSRDELVRNADRAMYEAKRTGGGRARVFEAAMEQRAQRRAVIEAELPRALESGQLHLEYQPRFVLASRTLCGAEALLRWAHPQLGAVAPGEFVSLAERCGAIHQIGAWAIEETCREIAAWRELAPSDRLACSVNVSPLQLRDEDFARIVTDALIDYQLEPRQLELEITESMLLDRSATVSRNLAQLSDAGVGIAIDDFGSGYSSLSALLSLPLTAVKLDRSIVQQIESSAAAQRVIAAVVSMARGLGCKVVAEGVDGEAQEIALRELGVDEAQGFLFSAAIAPVKFHTLLSQKRG